MAQLAVDTLHLLSINLGSAPSSMRAVLELGREDAQHWLRRAAAAGVPLAIVCGPGSVDLYSTAEGRRTAFKPLLESVWSLSRKAEGVAQVRAIEASGHAVVRHLLRQAAGLESTEHGLSYAGCIAEARRQAAEHGTLSRLLEELFELARDTADRSRSETEIAAPHSTRASRQIEALTAERILEEQLTAFRVASAAAVNDSQARPTLRSGPRPSLTPGYGQEPGSEVRLRIPSLSLPALGQRRFG